MRLTSWLAACDTSRGTSNCASAPPPLVAVVCAGALRQRLGNPGQACLQRLQERAEKCDGHRSALHDLDLGAVKASADPGQVHGHRNAAAVLIQAEPIDVLAKALVND